MIDETRHQGLKLWKLTILKNLGGGYYDCLCECGSISRKRMDLLRTGEIKSCGCWKRERATLPALHPHYKDGRSLFMDSGKRGAYHSWRAMLARCNNPRHQKFKYYGGRGVKVCAHWLSFEYFFADMGPRPPKLSLDRKNNGGDYSPINCRWTTQSEQLKNRRPFKRKKP